jgi:hypothetical protein
MDTCTVELVQRLTGRVVEASLNASHVQPDLTALVFVFAPTDAG